MDQDQLSVTTDAEPGGIPAPATGSGVRWRRGLDPQDVDRLNQARGDHAAIVEEIPVDKAGLGAFSVACLLFNRLIGSGIFNSSSVIFYNTQSIGASLLIWLYGVVMAMSGVLLYIELGLTVPRWQLRDGTKISTPRSGAELVYFNYFLKVPKYLATCVFGVSFLVFGNTATNSVAFAVATLQAAGVTSTANKIVGIAIAANTFSCLLHSMSRKWGIRLNNLLGSLKLLLLVVMIIFGLAFLDRNVSDANFSSRTAFSRTPQTPTGVYRYAEALIYVVFPFGGFHQANYVLAEIKNPRRNFAWTSGFSVGLLCVLFMVVNVLYAAIIPKEVLFQPGQDVALEFFMRTIGHASSDPRRVQAACGALRALSAIGNVIVFTFTAARVKQEVAKEGIFPFSLYFASSYEFSLRHGFRRLPAHKAGHHLYTQKAPAAAVALHWTITTVLILAAVLGTAAAETAANGIFSHLPGYSLLMMAYAYGLDIVWFTVIGVAMLWLRLWPGSNWRYKSPIPHALGVAAAVVFTATSVFPLVAIWVPDPLQPFMARSNRKVPWYASQTMTLAILGAAGVYWLGFRFYLWHRRTRHAEVLKVTRIPVFKGSQGGQGGLVLLYEIIRLQWKDWVPSK
ncbi:amino acid permease-domain-containing protein [Chaetomium tenue]|uniref:Amino acid permease-domain-containing protein n=1 Tax=Chaetomium tenue TaxID=1854479 RepID=A0ACB7NWH0_9PEZI|nr:amino acid permease-domain-containing protein [Chaetomium globosum]